MTDLLNTLLYILTAMLALPAAVVATECILALLPRQRQARGYDRQQHSVTVLIPAHNEEHSIQATIRSVLPQLLQQDRLLVVADHCTDRTVEVATSAGAGVIKHQGQLPRGKGHALNAGLGTLIDNPPDIVLILDADCILEPGSLEILAGTALRTERPAQAQYILDPPDPHDIPGLISAFAFLVRNAVRPAGLARLGLPCHLMGTGMAFPWTVISETPVPVDHLVEDLQMGIDLLRKRQGPVFCFPAKVTSQLPPSRDGAMTQRRRWEHGHLRTMLREAPGMLLEAITRRRADLIVPALDLAVPPLSLLVLILTTGLLLGTCIALAGGPTFPVAILAAVGFYFLAAIFGAWVKYARKTLPVIALLKAPFYVLSKLPLYSSFFTTPQHTWHERSERKTDK